jgi:chemotaxis-related protein WspB
MQALVFSAGAASYAVRLTDIVQVLPLCKLRELPQAPYGVRGLLQFRGQWVPVVDLRLLLEGVQSNFRLSTRVLLIKVSPKQVGAPATAANRDYLFALTVEVALHVVPITRLLPGFNMARAPYLSSFMDNAMSAQLIEPAALLPAELFSIYSNQPAAEVTPSPATAHE